MKMGYFWKNTMDMEIATHFKDDLFKPMSSDSLCEIGKAMSVLLFNSSDFSLIV